MGRTEIDTNLVIQELKAIGHSCKYTSGNSHFRIGIENNNLPYLIAVFLDRLDETLLYFDNELPVSSNLPKELLLRFYNHLNAEIEFGKFFYHEERKKSVFQNGVIYRYGQLNSDIINDAYYVSTQTPIKYIQRIKTALKHENLSDAEMIQIIQDKALDGEDEKSKKDKAPKKEDPQDLSFGERYAPPKVRKKGPYKLVLHSLGTDTLRKAKMMFRVSLFYDFDETKNICSSLPYPLKEYLSLETAQKYLELFSHLDFSIEIEEENDIDGSYKLILIDAGIHRDIIVHTFDRIFDLNETEAIECMKSESPRTMMENLSLKRAKRYIELFEDIEPQYRPKFKIEKAE